MYNITLPFSEVQIIVLIGQASGLEAFSRYPYRIASELKACRLVQNTRSDTTEFLSYYLWLPAAHAAIVG